MKFCSAVKTGQTDGLTDGRMYMSSTLTIRIAKYHLYINYNKTLNIQSIDINIINTYSLLGCEWSSSPDRNHHSRAPSGDTSCLGFYKGAIPLTTKG